jgi:hypothetical protein
MENIDDIDEPPIFHRHEWIGRKNIYSRKELPLFVLDACDAAFAIPANEMTRFPNPSIAVTNLLKKSLPPKSAALVMSKPATWFSNAPPQENIDFLDTRPIPDDDFLDKLQILAFQAWLDGAQSIIDQRYNDGTDRLPLWILAYWRSMSKVIKARAVWRKCERWLAVEPDSRLHNGDMTQAFESARAFLPGLGWDTPVSALDQRLTTFEFTNLLGTEWLSTSLVQMMVDHLTARVRADPSLACSTIIGGPGLAEAIDHAALSKQSYTRMTTPLLCRYEQHIKDTNIEHLYFPAHVNTNHWVTVYINFHKREFSYGESNSTFILRKFLTQ